MKTDCGMFEAYNIHNMAKAQKPKRRNIDPAEWVVKELSIEAIEKGYRGFKPYAEYLLEEHAKKRLSKKK